MNRQLHCASYLAPNWFGFYQAIAQFLQRVLDIDVGIVQRPFDPLDDPLLLNDQFDVILLCGLPFIRHHTNHPNQFCSIIAPVMQGARYGDRPVYFSDVIVSSGSAITSVSQLDQKTFCYNDLGSNSGYHMVRCFLQQHGFPTTFLDTQVQSGAHQVSISWIVDGLADWAAIDSVVLERALQIDPTLANKLRVIASIGPCPMPPLVAAQHLGQDVLSHIRMAFLHPDQPLQQAMQQVGVKRFAPVNAENYGAIARLYQISQAYGQTDE